MTNPITALNAYQQVANIAPMSADARAAIRENVLQFFCTRPQAQDEPEGLTALYERLSQEDKNAGESESIANQKKILERYCKEHGYTAIRHYDEDDGYSGTTFNRPGFQRMLADVKAGKIARVIVKDMSRFGRDYLQVGMYTDIIFPEYGVQFIAVNDGVDSARGENEFAAIRNVFNEMYARDTSKKIRATWQSKGKSGERLTTNPPYGYCKDPDNKKNWIVDKEAAAVVQTVFSLCVQGMGPAKIANWLRQQKILCPAAYWNAKGVKNPYREPPNPCIWSSATVASMLERIEYLGHTVNFRTTRKSYKHKKTLWNDPDDWAIFENTHEPIIEESVFMVVQNLRRSRRRPTKMGDMGLFSGLLYCEDCGGIMYLTRTSALKPEQEYYICSNYRKDRALCTTHTIRTVVLKEIVLNHLREAIAYVSQYEDDFVREAAQATMRERDKELARKKDELASAEKRISELDLIIKRLYEDNVTGKLSDERFIKLSHDYELEQSELKTSSEAARQAAAQQEQKKGSVKSFIAITRKYTELQELDAAVLREFVDRIEISAMDKNSKERRIHIVYNFIGAFDFGTATQQVKTNNHQGKTA